MNTDIRICHFLNECSYGGTVDMIVSLITHSKYWHTYVTYHANDYRKDQFAKLGIELVELGNNFDLAVAYMKEHANVVHASFSGGPEPGVGIGLASNKPTIETVQSPDLPQGSIHNSVHVIPVSQGITAYWPDYLRYDRVIYSCAEPINRKSKEKAKSAFGLDPNKITIGRVGRLEGLKRSTDFLHTVDYLHRKGRNYQYLLVGDGNDRTGLAGMINEMRKVNPGFNVIMPGFLTGELKDYAYNAIDVFLYPTSMEGFGCVFAEAMSIGLPIVTYSDPVNVDIVGEAGLYTTDNLYFRSDAETYQALALLTEELLQNKREYDKLSKWGHQRYDRYFTPQRMANEYDSLYEEIVNG